MIASLLPAANEIRAPCESGLMGFLWVEIGVNVRRRSNNLDSFAATFQAR